MSVKTVLIVEDDADLRRIYSLALHLAGFAVRECGDGFSALNVLDEQPPDCVILDLMLPVVSGETVKQELAARAETSQIPVVIVTGSDADVAALDANCVLRKPASPEAIVAAVKRCIAAGSAHGTSV